jgi:hypothetical protein
LSERDPVVVDDLGWLALVAGCTRSGQYACCVRVASVLGHDAVALDRERNRGERSQRGCLPRSTS